MNVFLWLPSGKLLQQFNVCYLSVFIELSQPLIVKLNLNRTSNYFLNNCNDLFYCIAVSAGNIDGRNTCITPFRQLNEGLGAIFCVYVIPNRGYISEH